MFRLSAITLALVSATGAHAALYDIVEITGLEDKGNEAYGVAVAEFSATDAIENCFVDDCTTAVVATGNEIRNGAEGFPFKEEAPLAYDNRFHILDEDDLEYYCDRERGYNSCENWASSQWYGSNGFGGLRREREAYYNGYSANAKGFVNTGDAATPVELQQNPPASNAVDTDSATFSEGSNNVVVTGFVNNATQDPIGITSSGYYELSSGRYGFAYRDRGFVGDAVLLPGADTGIVATMGRTMAFDSFEHNGSTFVIGSAAVAGFNASDSNKDYGGDLNNCTEYDFPGEARECQHYAFATKAYVWELDSVTGELTGSAVSNWKHGEGSNRNDYTSIASARSAAIVEDEVNTSGYDGLPVLAGYNVVKPDNDNNFGMEAGIYYPIDGFNLEKTAEGETPSDQWSFVTVANATIYDNGENAYVFSNSRTTGINSNLVAIGESKLRYNRALNGALANRLFSTDASDKTNLNASYFSGGIFFSGAGGKANSINNFNEVVGSIDAENAREDGGKQRRRRGFINPLGAVNELGDAEAIEERREIFQNKPWWIDDLTNDGLIEGNNNQYRIIEAGAINDAGVISATAIKCDGGYDSTSHNSYCGGGSQKELVVAVKLIPKNVDAEIIQRSADVAPVERQGAGIGAMLLGLFGIYLFRKRQ
jgi:hypothetical protein